MKKKLGSYILISVLLIAGGNNSFAQFYATGDDPAGIKWFTVKTPAYRIVYPEGLDSLAREYALQLERYRMPVSWSTGLVPGSAYRNRTPIVLHAYNAVSNGSVVWAPRRMDLYTVPEAYSPEPLPWIQNLAVHESRHLSQMQFGHTHLFKPFNYITGQLVASGLSAIYPSTHLLEGDAVVAETALTTMGRGRNADFLSYYMTAFDNGDWRNWHKWRWGSYRNYTPNHYAIGYLTIAGTRYLYDDPLFMEKYFDKVTRRPWRLFNMQKQMKAASGLKFKATFSEIMHEFDTIWKEEAEMRAPFSDFSPISEIPSWYTSYSRLSSGDNDIFAVKGTLREAPSLVRVLPSGEEETIRPFASGTSSLVQFGDRLFWSEYTPDVRWSLKGTSRIKYLDLGSRPKIHTLTTEGRLFNPSVSDDGKKLAVVEYPIDGRTFVLELDSESGEILSRHNVPDSVQAVQPVWIGEEIYFSGISNNGFGIYSVSAGHPVKEVLSPEPVTIHALNGSDGKLVFSSDRTGVDEAYMMDPGTGSVFQMTSSRYGTDNPRVIGDSLYVTQILHEGKLVSRTGLSPKEVDFGEHHRYPVADKLTEQEKAIAASLGEAFPEEVSQVEISQPKRYYKVPHLPRIHSWAPVFTNGSAISEASFESVYNDAALGATIFFQNDLSTLNGSLGAFFFTESESDKFRSGAQLDMTYSGLYPVFHLTTEVGRRDARQYFRRRSESGPLVIDQVGAVALSTPLVSSELEVYVPLNFSSGGWSRGLIPRVDYYITNDRYSKALTVLDYSHNLEGSSMPIFTGQIPGKNVPMQYLTTTVRGYTMRPTASSAVYPRLGVSLELGYRSRIALSDLYTAAVYGYAYGYLPGFVPQQGLRLSAMYQRMLRTGTASWENSISVQPRGFEDSRLGSYLSSYAKNQMRFTADYAIPINAGDISWFSPLVMIKNFVFKPHFDISAFSVKGESSLGSLYSAGADFTLVSGNFFWLPYETEFGISAGYNGGKSYNAIEALGYEPGRVYLQGVFKVDI